MSFQVGKGLNFHFGGLANIQRLAQDPVFIRALTNTCIFLFVQVPIMITLALRRFAIPPRCFRAASARNAP